MTRSLVKDFIKTLNGLDPSKDRYTKFRDFLTLAYCALAKPVAVAAERAEALEADYMAVVGRYANQDDVRAMPKLLGMTALTDIGQALAAIESTLPVDVIRLTGHLTVLRARD